MINLSGVMISRIGSDGHVQLTLLGEDGTPMRYEYAGEVFASVHASSEGRLSVLVKVEPTKQESVGQNNPKRLFDG